MLSLPLLEILPASYISGPARAPPRPLTQLTSPINPGSSHTAQFVSPYCRPGIVYLLCFSSIEDGPGTVRWLTGCRTRTHGLINSPITHTHLRQRLRTLKLQSPASSLQGTDIFVSKNTVVYEVVVCDNSLKDSLLDSKHLIQFLINFLHAHKQIHARTPVLRGSNRIQYTSTLLCVKVVQMVGHPKHNCRGTEA